MRNTRALDEVLAELPDSYSKDDVAFGWNECLDNMPAEQQQGESPNDDKSHPRFIAGYTAGLYDHKLGQQQGVPVAMPARKHHSNSSFQASCIAAGWNACLDEIAKLGPLYAHADPAEVERISRKAANADLALAAQTKQVHNLREGLDNANINIANWAKANQKLKAQLAERDALLREVRPSCHPKHFEKIDAALSASAEPRKEDQ